MDVLTQIIVSGLTLGAMYAISTVGLSLVYGSLNMLNMAHGGILTIGGYAAYAVSQQLGWPPAFGFVAALVRRITGGRRHLLWIRQDFAARESGDLAMAGFAALGLDPRPRSPDGRYFDSAEGQVVNRLGQSTRLLVAQVPGSASHTPGERSGVACQ